MGKAGFWKMFMRKIRAVVFSIIIGAIIFYGGPLFAQDMGQMMEELQQLKETNKALMEKVQNLEKRMSKYETTNEQAIEAGKETESLKADIEGLKKIKEALGHLEISGGVTSIVQGTGNNGDNPPNYDDSTDGSFTMDLNLATHFGRYGNFYVHLEGGDGEGLNDDVASFSVPNYDSWATANHNNQTDLTISEAFYEFGFLDEKFLFDAGKMDISVLFDENEAAGDETTQFLSNIFVKSMGLTIPEPDNFYCPAFMVKIAPLDLLEFRVVGASVEDNNWEDVFDHGFLAWQVNLQPTIKGRQGNYRFYGWWDKRKHLKNHDLATANSREDPGYDDPLADKDQMGWGISFDQEIMEGITGFVRYSQTNDDFARWNGNEWEMIPFDRLWTAGAQLSGSLWNRKSDVFGIGYGGTLLTNDYEKVDSHTANEKYIEAYYRLALHERFALSADFQWVQNAGGDSRADDVYIYGLRAQVDF